MSEAESCCGTLCDRFKLKADQLRVVDAFDKLTSTLRGGTRPPLDRSLQELGEAIACLRETK